MDTLMRRFRKTTIRDKRETYFRVERVPKELMYMDFVYPEEIQRHVPNSEVAFDAAKRFDALEPLDPKLWNQELMRRDEWFKHWTQFNLEQGGATTHRLARHTGRAGRLARARFQAYGGRT
jgi:hypothetical protein